MSLAEISAAFNVSHVTIKNWLVKIGVELRTIKESNSLHQTKEKRREKMLSKYGVTNPMQLVDVHLKAMKSGYRLKSVNIAGREFMVQGYEPQVLHYLVNQGIDVKSKGCSYCRIQTHNARFR